jgi:hypothetical protein
MRHISSVPGQWTSGPCRWLRKTGPARKQKEGSGWEKTWGFSGAVAEYGVLSWGKTIDGREATPQHRCGEWVKGSTITLQRRETERERCKNNKEGVIKIGSNAAGVIDLGGLFAEWYILQ